MKILRFMFCAATAVIGLATAAHADSFTDGLANEWVGDDYVYGVSWVDRVSSVSASLDGNNGNAYPPVVVTGVFGPHGGVQRDPAQTASTDAGFSIPGGNAPTTYSNYTVSAVIYSTVAGPSSDVYFGCQLIAGYDIGGLGKHDWGFCWGGNGNGGNGFIAGMGLATPNTDQELSSPTVALSVVHAVALQVGDGTMSLFVDGALVRQQTGLATWEPEAPSSGVIPLLSTVGGNISQVFPGALAEFRIYTNSTVDGAALTAYLQTNYAFSASLTSSANATGAIVGSNAMVTLSVPPSVTDSSPLTITLTSDNTAVVANQTVILPVGVSSTNLGLSILGTGVAHVAATAPGVTRIVLQVTGVLPSIRFTPSTISATVGNDATATLNLVSPFPFSGPYTVTLTSDNPTVVAGQTVTVPAGATSASVTFPVLSTGYANLAATGDGLNPGSLAVGTMPEVLTDGLNNQWVGDDYSYGGSWVDRVSGASALSDGYPYPPVVVTGVFGPHGGVQRDPAQTASTDAGFIISPDNAPTTYSNYTVSAVIYSTVAGPSSDVYFGCQLIAGYQIGGLGKHDWGFCWGGNGNGGNGFIAGIGLAAPPNTSQDLSSPTVALSVVHAVALQVGSGTMSLFVDGALVKQATGLATWEPEVPNGAIPLLSTVGANISQVFPGALAEFRIYTNSTVDGAALTAYLQTNYAFSASFALSTNATGAIVGSNAMVTLSVPPSVTDSSPLTITLTSDNTAVVANQTVILPVGVSSTNLGLSILGTGVAHVAATAPVVAPITLQVTGVLPSIRFTPGSISATVGNDATVTLNLVSPFPFNGPYTVTLTSDNPTVVAGQTVTVPAGATSASVTFPVLSTGYANLAATGDGLNPGSLAVGTTLGVLSDGLANEWVGDDYVYGVSWVDRVSSVSASLDGNNGNAYPPVVVTGVFGPHGGVQRDPAQTASTDAGFSIPGGNAPTTYSNYTVSAVIYSTVAGPSSDVYFGCQLIAGYDIGGLGKHDWGFCWGGNGNGGNGFIAGMGLATPNTDQELSSPTVALSVVHAVALQVGDGTMSLFVDGALVRQQTGLATWEPEAPSSGVIPLLSTVGGNISQVFPGALAEFRIYTNSTVDGAALTSYLLSQYSSVSIETPVILSPELISNGTEMLLKVDTQIGVNYQLESTTNLAEPFWTTNGTTAGTGDIITNTVPINPAQPSVFYRYVAQ